MSFVFYWLIRPDLWNGLLSAGKLTTDNRYKKILPSPRRLASEGIVVAGVYVCVCACVTVRLSVLRGCKHVARRAATAGASR